MKNFKMIAFLFAALTMSIGFTSCEKDLNEIIANENDMTDEESDASKGENYVNKITNDRQLLVLSAPSVNNDYYYEDFYEIIGFMVDYANTIMHNDNVVVVADNATMPYLKGKLPQDVLLKSKVKDIWMRDFTTVFPKKMIQFTYSPTYLPYNFSSNTQWSFVNFTDKYGLTYDYEDLILDGGNIVDNNKNRVITTERFLEDNYLTVAQGKQLLKEILGVQYVSVIPYDDEVMGHADGMVMFSDDNTVLVNKYDEPFRSQVINTLKADLPNTKIVETDVTFDDTVWDDFASACGINLNSTVTDNFIYVPTFGSAAESSALQTIESNTTKTVKTIDAQGVCHMGGSVRCLTWQAMGQNAKKLIEAARNY
ncbi:MAG: agmatine deiminase family protein [Chitinophagales bacterium]